jgi:hypothetical protein
MKHLYFLLLFLPLSLFAQQQASGVYNAPGDGGFNKVNWSFTYEVEMGEAARADLNGPLFVTFSNESMNVASAKFNYDGKSYSPAEAGMSSWPEVQMEYSSMTCDVAVYYRGSLVKEYKQLSVKNRSVLIGRFDSHKGTPPNDRVGIFLGGEHISSTDFNLSNMKLEISNVKASWNAQPDVVVRSILNKEKAALKPTANNTTSVSIGSPSSGAQNTGSTQPGNTGSSQQAEAGVYGTNTTGGAAGTTTWEQTNARIKEENQRAYDVQRQKIAETQRQDKELSDQIVSGTSEIVGMIGNMIQQNRADKEKKEAYRAKVALELRQAQIEEQQRLKEAARKNALRLQLRNALFADYKDAEVPLSSHQIPVRVLYYFAYAYDKKNLSNDKPILNVSNVFTVAQYADDTWPFKKGLINQMRIIQPQTTIAFAGYYTQKSEAEEARKHFKEMAAQSEFTVSDFVYKSKAKPGDGDSDFFETGNPNGNPQRADLRIANGDEDFFETGQFKKKLAEEKKKEEAKKAGAKPADTKKTAPKPPVKKDDFWND